MTNFLLICIFTAILLTASGTHKDGEIFMILIFVVWAIFICWLAWPLIGSWLASA